MTNELRRRNAFSTDIMIDAVGTKNVFDLTAIQPEEKVKGYISNIGLNPYGFLLFSEIQVTIVKNLSTEIFISY
jgi:hypothetical protein